MCVFYSLFQLVGLDPVFALALLNVFYGNVAHGPRSQRVTCISEPSNFDPLIGNAENLFWPPAADPSQKYSLMKVDPMSRIADNIT